MKRFFVPFDGSFLCPQRPALSVEVPGENTQVMWLIYDVSRPLQCCVWSHLSHVTHLWCHPALCAPYRQAWVMWLGRCFPDVAAPSHVTHLGLISHSEQKESLGHVMEHFPAAGGQKMWTKLIVGSLEHESLYVIGSLLQCSGPCLLWFIRVSLCFHGYHFLLPTLKSVHMAGWGKINCNERIIDGFVIDHCCKATNNA